MQKLRSMVAVQQDKTEKRNLRDFTRLLLAFFGSLVVLAIYQNLRLYALGVLDGLVGKSLFLLFLHHLGFAALIALPMSFLFKFLESKKPGLGFKTVGLVLLLLLLVEGMLIEFYVNNYEILGPGFVEVYASRITGADFILGLAILSPICIGSYYVLYRLSASTYKLIGRMYPFTIILFTLFLATLYSDKKPVNENKTQHLVVHATSHALDLNKYEGAEEYPLLYDYEPDKSLVPYFDLKEGAPNLVFIVLEGIGSDFVGKNSIYKGLTPFLDSLASSSLYWSNHLSNTGEGHASLPSILGSLPFGDTGFNKTPGRVNRNTILGILKKNGYNTSFYYGGNSALNQWDKFLFEDRIDNMLDIKGFGDDYIKQKEDAAGISLGYPDKELFRKWEEDRMNYQSPYVEVFFTLSSKKPFQIPGLDSYIEKAEQLAAQMNWGKRESRIFRKNKEVFASVNYVDDALRAFIDRYSSLPEYHNTIFIITGSHNMTELPSVNELSRYQVPLIIHSPLMNTSKEMDNLVSHADILPSVLGLLKNKYDIRSPKKVSFMSHGLGINGQNEGQKNIPLFRHKGVTDFVYGDVFVSDGDYYQIGQDMSLADFNSDSQITDARIAFREFRAVNKYVTRENKLLPEKELLFAHTARQPNKQEMIWINSVFSGTDFDNAYKTARSLALEGDYDRALLLGSYILNEVPGHADTEILMGRIYAWSGSYDRATEILEGAILKYPVYADAYSALLDVYFWSGDHMKALQLQQKIIRQGIKNKELDEKLDRVQKKINQDQRSSEREQHRNKIINAQTVVINEID